MKFDVTIFADDLNAAGELAQRVEAFGFDGLWVAEAAHNPFFPLAHAALATRRISLGTAIAVAFPRSPMLMAQTAWDLAQQSEGRFILGLGTQIKPHITKRFSRALGKTGGAIARVYRGIARDLAEFSDRRRIALPRSVLQLLAAKVHLYAATDGVRSHPDLYRRRQHRAGAAGRRDLRWDSMYIRFTRQGTCAKCCCRHSALDETAAE